MNRDIKEKSEPLTGQFDKEKNYWLKKITPEVVKSNFQYDVTDKDTPGFSSGAIDFKISADIYSKLEHLSNRSDNNLFVVLAAVLSLLLNKYTGNHDIVIGCPILKQEVEGKFLNTILALRNRLSPTMTFKELLLQVKNTFNEANENSNYPLKRLLYHLGLPGQAGTESTSSLFETVILLQNLHDRKYISKMNHNMVFRFQRRDQCLDGTLEYNADLYRKETIETIIAHFKNLLENILRDLNTQIFDIEILSERERQQMLVEFNDTRAPYPEDKVLPELFEDQVKRTPGNIAVSSGVSALTYSQLNEKANCLARFLREKGIGPDIIAGIMVTPSLEMVIGIMAISKAGGAFLPIDHESPRHRIEYLLKESHCSFLLTQGFLKEEVNFNGEKISIDEEGLYSGDNSDLDRISRPGDVFYMIYTSGTSGRPKGGLLTHRNMVNYITWFCQAANLTGKDKTMMASSFAFDLGYSTFLGSLLTGGQLHLVSKETYINAEALLAYIKNKGISYLKMTPSLFTVLVQDPGFSLETCLTLRLVVLGGEEINPHDVEKASQICSHIEVINHYGPTETTIGSVARYIDFDRFAEFKKNPTIGKPISNTEVYILSKYLKLVPIGIPGELLIGGHGVARGYLNNPELTYEKFDHDLWDYPDYRDKKNKSFCGGPGGSFFKKRPLAVGDKIYKTGDLARWMADGNIRFLGREDSQVKIRGFRVELGEIENQILKNDSIKDVLITAEEHKSTGKYLCAYVVPVPGRHTYNAAQLRDFLSENLPDFMIPSFFIEIDRIPLTPNGKVDRKALPLPGIKKPGKTIPPRDEVEESLADLWTGALQMEKELISVDTNFFELGGNSLSAAILAAKMHKAFDVSIPMVKIFERPTIETLAAYIKGASKEVLVSIPPAEEKEYYPLSSAQKRLYIHKRMELESTAGNLFEAVELEGRLDREKLAGTVRELIRRHESLRTCFRKIGEKYYQKVLPASGVEFEIEYYSSGRQGEREAGSLLKDSGRQGEREAGSLLKNSGRQGEREAGNLLKDSGRQVSREIGNLLENSGRQGNRETGNLLKSNSLIPGLSQKNPLSLSPSLPELIQNFTRPFDLSRAPLLRVGLIKEAGSKHILLFDMHHIISDGVSQRILIKDLITLYRGSKLPGLQLRYRDYSEWHQSQAVKKNLRQQEKYWLQEFRGEIPVLNMPLDYPRPVVQSFAGSFITFELNVEQTGALKEIARREEVTLFMVLLAIYSIFLSKLSGQEVIVVGTPVTGRGHPDLEKIIGMFANTLVLRICPSGEKRFTGFLKEVKEKTIKAFENQDYQYEDLVENLVQERDMSRNPLFDVMFALQSLHDISIEVPGSGMEGLTIKPYAYDHGTARRDLTLAAVESEDKLDFRFEYCTSLFREETMERFIKNFKEVISSVLANPGQKISRIEIGM